MALEHTNYRGGLSIRQSILILEVEKQDVCARTLADSLTIPAGK